MNDLVEVQSERLQGIDRADRGDWTYQMYVAAGQEIVENRFYTNWLIGKLAYEGTERWGECSKYAREIGLEAGKVLACRGVFKKFYEANPDYTPDGFLPWGAVSYAARSEDPIKMVNKLADGNVRTAEEAHRMLMTEKTGIEVPTKPKIKLKWNPEVRLWDIHMEEKDFDVINWEHIGKKIYSYLASLWND